MHEMWIQNLTLTTGLVDTVSIPTLLKMVASGRIPAEKMGTHTFTFGEMDEAYDVFSNAAANSALKVSRQPPDRRRSKITCWARFPVMAEAAPGRPVRQQTSRRLSQPDDSTAILANEHNVVV